MQAEPVAPKASACRKVLLVDDHPVLRAGLTALIATEPDLTVCGEAATVDEALTLVATEQPDLAIVDLSLAGHDGLELLQILKSRHPSVQSLVLTMHDEFEYAPRCLRAGARCYLHKQSLNESILESIRRILDGELCISSALTARLAQSFMDSADPPARPLLHMLSDRELQVYRLIGEGHASREIAEILSVSVRTVDSHIQHIKNKQGLPSADALARQAAEWVDAKR